ncbi:MAG: hypothetical protein PHZ09_10770 [Eubacteriales bacterium]|nr:hypothetical protein [Eubacteriales bacterium]
MDSNRDIGKEIIDKNQQRIKNGIKNAGFIENRNEPMYINPPHKILLSNLMFSFIIMLVFVILAYKVFAFLLLIYLLYFFMSLKLFGRLWQLCGYSQVVLIVIIITGLAADAVIGFTLQKLLIVLLRMIVMEI